MVREFTLQNFVELAEPANLDVVRAHGDDGGRGDAGLRAIWPSRSPTTWRATPRGAQKALLYIAVMLPLWSSYLVRLYAWKLLLAKEGAISWLAQRAAPGVAARAAAGAAGDRRALA